MREKFLLLIVGIILASLAVGAVYLVLRSLFDVFVDWQTGKELKWLSKETSQLREEREREHQERLQNGCEHQWGGFLVGFPAEACCRCGLEKQRPTGPCDHVWRSQLEEVPAAVCETCGKQYQRPQSVI